MQLEQRQRQKRKMLQIVVYAGEFFLVAELILWIAAPSILGYGVGFSLWFKALLSAVSGLLLLAWLVTVLLPFTMLQAASS